MSELSIRLDLKEIITILESLSIDNFELNKSLIKKLMNQLGDHIITKQRLEIPLDIKERFWDRFQYFVEKLTT